MRARGPQTPRGRRWKRIRESDQKYKDNTFGAAEHRREAPLTEQQQQACVSASATGGAFLRYICRRDEHNAKVNEKFGYGGDVVSAKQQAR